MQNVREGRENKSRFVNLDFVECKPGFYIFHAFGKVKISKFYGFQAQVFHLIIEISGILTPKFAIFWRVFRKIELRYPKSASYDLLITLWGTRNAQKIGGSDTLTPKFNLVSIRKFDKIPDLACWSAEGAFYVFSSIFSGSCRKNEV